MEKISEINRIKKKSYEKGQLKDDMFILTQYDRSKYQRKQCISKELQKVAYGRFGTSKGVPK